jgi:hypothetical protein
MAATSFTPSVDFLLPACSLAVTQNFYHGKQGESKIDEVGNLRVVSAKMVQQASVRLHYHNAARDVALQEGSHKPDEATPGFAVMVTSARLISRCLVS